MDIIETMDSFKCVIDSAKEEISEKLAKLFMVNNITDIDFKEWGTHAAEIAIMGDYFRVLSVYLESDELFVNGYCQNSDSTMTINVKSLPFESLQELVFMIHSKY